MQLPQVDGLSSGFIGIREGDESDVVVGGIGPQGIDVKFKVLMDLIEEIHI